MGVKETQLFELPESFEKRSAIAKSKGFEYLGRLMHDDTIPTDRLCDHGRYKRLKCGHITTYLHRTVAGLKNPDYCNKCMKSDYIDLVSNLDMEFLKFSRKAKNGTLYVDVVLPCGHYKSIQTGNLRIGAYHCSECWKIDFIRLLASYGLIYKRHVTGNNYEVTLPCGCDAIKHINNLKTGTWTCSEHKRHYLDDVGYIYLFEISYKSKKWLKLGFSTNPDNRSKFFSQLDISTYLIDSVHFQDARVALKIEKSLHTKYIKSKIQPDVMKQIMFNGFSECYPLEMKDVLLSEIAKYKVIDEVKYE